MGATTGAKMAYATAPTMACRGPGKWIWPKPRMISPILNGRGVPAATRIIARYRPQCESLYGNSAKKRARLMAVDSWRCFCVLVLVLWFGLFLLVSVLLFFW